MDLIVDVAPVIPLCDQVIPKRLQLQRAELMDIDIDITKHRIAQRQNDPASRVHAVIALESWQLPFPVLCRDITHADHAVHLVRFDVLGQHLPLALYSARRAW